MPWVTDAPTAEIRSELQALAVALDDGIPAKALDIRAFGGLTEKWRSADEDSPKRDLASLATIGQIISRFDVVGVQEVRGNIKALRGLLRYLGS